MIEPLNVTLSGPWVVLLLLVLGLPLAVVVLFLERFMTRPPRWATATEFFKGARVLATAFITGTAAFFTLWFTRFNSASARASGAAGSAAPGLAATSFDDVLNVFLLIGFLIFLVLFAVDRRNEPFGVESHWGGLGDGLSGRRVSISIVHLAVAFILLGILVTRTPAGRTLLELMRAQHASQASPATTPASTHNPSASKQSTSTETQASDAEPAKGASAPVAPVPPPPK